MRSFKGIRYSVVDKLKGTASTEKNETEKSIIFNYPCETTYECTPYSLIFPPGKYKFELWGAQGGDSRYWNIKDIRPDSGGKGAYVSGTLFLQGIHKMFLYIGGKGEDQASYSGRVVSKGGFNGGGNGGVDEYDDSFPESSAGGGGATDVRLAYGDNLRELKSRIMVAAAGGGSSSINDTNDQQTYLSGNGGTLTGGWFSKNQIPGNQTSGIFGKGQDGISMDNSFYGAGGSTGGSGGGYYGGITIDEQTKAVSHYEVPGAGGSSYVSGFEGCNSVIDDNSDPPVHSGKSMHYSNLFFNDPSMKMFRARDFLDPHGKFENGHSGNGVAKITVIEAKWINVFYCTNHKTATLHKFVTMIIVLIVS